MPEELKACPCYKNKKGQMVHPNAIEVSDSQENGFPSGDVVTMNCLDCEEIWEKELPQ